MVGWRCKNPDLYTLVKVGDLGLSVRLRNRFALIGVVTVSDLLHLTKKDLLNIKGFGATCLREVDALLNELRSDDFTYETEKGTSLSEELLPYLDNLKNGDFGFSSAYGLSDNAKIAISRYKAAYEVLGPDFAQEAAERSPSVYAIRDTLYDYSLEYVCKSQCNRMIRENIPESRKDTSASLVIKGFSKDDETKEQLLQLCSDVDENIADFIMSNYQLMTLKRELIPEIIEWCNFDLNSEVSNFFTKTIKKERSIEVLKMRSAGHTLEAVGEAFGVTRERIRQIERKTVDSFKKWQKRQRFVYKALIALCESTSFSPLQLEDYCCDYGKELVYILKSCDSDDFIYDRQLDLFIVEDLSLVDKVQSFVDSLPDTFDESDYDKTIRMAEKDYEYPQNMVAAVIGDNYKKTGKVFHRTRLTLEKIYTDIISKYYPDGIHIYSEQDGVRKHVFEEYGIDLSEKSDHASLAAIILLN